MKTFLSILLVGVLAGLGGWWIGTHQSAAPDAAKAGDQRKVLYYQSTMHPWVKSDKPGKCTVCGMDLVPVYEGGQNFDAARTDIVMLPEGSPAVANVQTVEVTKKPLVRTLRVAGTIDDDDSRHRIVSAYIPGRLDKLFVNYEGAEVKEGQPIASFFSKELLTAVNEYRVVLSGTAPGSLISAAESRLLKMGLTPAQIKEIPQRTDKDIHFDILAPVTGTVVQKFVYEGQYVQEGEKLFEIADFSTMWFQFTAYEQDLPFIREGQTVVVTTPSLPGRTFPSTVRFINPNLDDLTRSAKVRVELKNPSGESGLHRGHEMLHKLYATATVEVDAPEVIAVPRRAVLWSGGQARVYVEEGVGAYQQRHVSLGRAGDEDWEVLDGLAVGEHVVSSGNMLIDGQAQLNNLAAPESSPAPVPSPVLEKTSTAQDEEFKHYLTVVAELSENLASDDLPAFNATLAKLSKSGAPPKAAPDLAAARMTFYKLSELATSKSTELRQSFPEVRVFQCPMSNMAAEGLPKNAKWIQFTDDLHNPYMGRQMLACGTEVK